MGDPCGPEPFKSIWSGDLHGPKPYKFIKFGDLHGPKPNTYLSFGDLHGPKPCKFRESLGTSMAPMPIHLFESVTSMAPHHIIYIYKRW